MNLLRQPIVPIVAILLVACSTPATPGASQASASGSASAASASAVASASAAPADGEDIPEPEAFDCQYPFHEQPTVAGIANITDVRTGTHPGYDRVVFEFAQGTPEFSLERAEPPFSQDGSGNPLEVRGESFLRLTMRGGTKQMEDGSSSYDGRREFETDYTSLVHLVEGGDFEAQSTWYFGLRSDQLCARILILDDEPRIVIDISHPGVGARPRVSG